MSFFASSAIHLETQRDRQIVVLCLERQLEPAKNEAGVNLKEPTMVPSAKVLSVAEPETVSVKELSGKEPMIVSGKEPKKFSAREPGLTKIAWEWRFCWQQPEKVVLAG